MFKSTLECICCVIQHSATSRWRAALTPAVIDAGVASPLNLAQQTTTGADEIVQRVRNRTVSIETHCKLNMVTVPSL